MKKKPLKMTNYSRWIKPREMTVAEWKKLGLKVRQTGKTKRGAVGVAKYHNVITEYKGRKYHSKKEAEFAIELDVLVKQKEVISWRPQVSFPIVVKRKPICKYVVDFEVEYANGEKRYIEIKSRGTETAVWKLKWKLVQALYPDLVFQVVY